MEWSGVRKNTRSSEDASGTDSAETRRNAEIHPFSLRVSITGRCQPALGTGDGRASRAKTEGGLANLTSPCRLRQALAQLRVAGLPPWTGNLQPGHVRTASRRILAAARPCYALPVMRYRREWPTSAICHRMA
jgi:hypothetical protein